MPQDFNWVKYQPLFYYKPQAYTFSCFSACLQMALVNFGILAPVGRHIEDQFNNYMTDNLHQHNLDDAAPTLEQVQTFMLGPNFLGRERLTLLNYIENINDDAFETIQRLLQHQHNIALIGAIRDQGGHAVAIVKCKGFVVAINPGDFPDNYIVIGLNDIVPYHLDGHIAAIGCEARGWAIMDYCYIISNR